jgi:hypothetical protein
MKEYSKKRYGKLSVMVDISVPRKIDPDISSLDNLFISIFGTGFCVFLFISCEDIFFEIILITN